MGRSLLEASPGGDPAEARFPVHLPPDDGEHPAHSLRVACNMVDGIRTDFLVQAFSDRIFVLVTQLNKVGTIVR